MEKPGLISHRLAVYREGNFFLKLVGGAHKEGTETKGFKRKGDGS